MTEKNPLNVVYLQDPIANNRLQTPHIRVCLHANDRCFLFWMRMDTGADISVLPDVCCDNLMIFKQVSVSYGNGEIAVMPIYKSRLSLIQNGRIYCTFRKEIECSVRKGEYGLMGWNILQYFDIQLHPVKNTGILIPNSDARKEMRIPLNPGQIEDPPLTNLSNYAII